MGKQENTALFPPVLKTFFHQIMIRLFGVALIAAGGCVAAALATYRITDPSFNTATGNVSENALGSFGSYLSDTLWQYFGFAALLFPISLVAWGVLVARLRWHRFQFLRVACFIPTLLLMLLICSSFPFAAGWPVYAGAGGAIMPAFYMPLIALLEKAYFPYPALIIIPTAFVFFVFSFAATMGIPFYLLKRWSASLKRGIKLCIRFILDRKNKAPDYDEHNLSEELPESLFTQQKLDLGEIPEPVEKKKVAPLKPSPLKSIKEHRDYQKQFNLPRLDFLAKPKIEKEPVVNREALLNRAKQLEGVLEEYGVKGKIVNVRPGPVVTLFELEPAAGIKTTRVINLADDIARSMSALSVRIAVVPGQSVIGIEMPNEKRADVYLKEMFATEDFKKSEKPLTLALGKDIGGKPTFTDLAKMPHLLVAGTTGSGKSVAINTMILSLLYRLTPEQCRFIMIDPKMLELSVYNGIPHLLTPVVTDPKKAVLALNWAVREMDDRYQLMSQIGVRNIDGYNTKIKEMLASNEPTTRTVLTGYDDGVPIYEEQPLNLRPFPYIVVIVDEMADLMLTAGKDIEVAIQRIAQKARAAGIHLIMATQRPSVDVITGTIKANFPERISFRVTTKIDSRTILGEQGAEQLLGRGDMLYLAQGQRAVRLHGPFVSDAEVEEITAHLRLQGIPQYEQAVTEEPPENTAESGLGGSTSGRGAALDEEASLYDKAVDIVLRDRKPTISYIQRQLRIGYNRAADLIDQMEREGVVSAPNVAGKREILVPERT